MQIWKLVTDRVFLPVGVRRVTAKFIFVEGGANDTAIRLDRSALERDGRADTASSHWTFYTDAGRSKQETEWAAERAEDEARRAAILATPEGRERHERFLAEQAEAHANGGVLVRTSRSGGGR